MLTISQHYISLGRAATPPSISSPPGFVKLQPYLYDFAGLLMQTAFELCSILDYGSVKTCMKRA